MTEELMVPPNGNYPEEKPLSEPQVVPINSPESRLNQGLAREMYGKIRDAEERVFSPSTRQSSATPHIFSSKDSAGFELIDSLHAHNPEANVNEIINTRVWKSNGMSQTTKVKRIDDNGSFHIGMDLIASRVNTTPRIMALTYHAPDPETGTPERISIIDSGLTGSAEQLLSPDNPRYQHTLDNLLVGLETLQQTTKRAAKAEMQGGYERTPLDYTQLVEGDIDIVMFGESHCHTAAMDSLARNAHLLSKAGIRAFLLEARSDQDLSDINRGDFTRLDNGEIEIGPDLKFLSPKEYQQLGVDPIASARIGMIKALVREGIAIVPVDSPNYHDYMQKILEAMDKNLPRPEGAVTQAEREEGMAQNIDAAVAQYGRVAGLFGRAHARMGERIDTKGRPYKETAQYAVDHGHSVRTVHFHGSDLYEGQARKPNSYLTENGWGSQEYMYRPAPDDLLTKTEPGSPDWGRPDWIVHIPPNQFEHEYGLAYVNKAPSQ